MSRLLIIDDEVKMAMLISDHLSESGHIVDRAAGGREAMVLLQRQTYDVVVTDLRLPPPDGLEILSWLSQHHPETGVIMMTAFAETKTAVEAMKKGAVDYLIKPFPLDELAIIIQRFLTQRKNENLKKLREADYEALAYDDFIGQAPATHRLLGLIRQVAPTDTTVLIMGESGTGKELAARLLHTHSPRQNKPFIAINCAALTETLLESEMFGHEKGAFTGAVSRKLGRFELAHGGTIFLDEIGEMSPGLQAKLLRVLEERDFVRVGGVDIIAVDVRIITATNRNLKELMKSGKFREDLYYRVNVFPLTMPTLRERLDDIPLLTEYFLRRKNFPYPILETAVIDLLRKYAWPGNVRELKNILDRAAILAGNGPINTGCLGIDEVNLDTPAPTTGSPASLMENERALIINALEKTGGSKTEAARLLGITRRRLYSRMKILGIEK